MKNTIAAVARWAAGNGGALLFIPAALLVLAGLGLVGRNPLTLLVLLAAAVTVRQVPALARDLVPALLTGLGLWGFALAALYATGSVRQVLYGAVLAGAGSWRTWLVLPQAVVFLAAGLWLARRTGAYGRLRAALGVLARLARGRSQRRLGPGWGLLLIPLAVQAFGVFGRNDWTWAAAIAAMLAALLLPGLAVQVLPAALVAVGLVGLALPFTVGRHSLSPYPFGELWYGPVWVSDEWRAVLAAVLGLLMVASGLWLFPRALASPARPGERAAALERRVRRLAQTRTDAVDAAAAELRRVERDLHDGAQARLVAVGMSLRAAERLMPASPQAALALIAEARETPSRALADLRDLIRGIHPPVLADRGLADAVRALALDTPLRVDTDIDLPGRPEPPVESAAYFAVAEVLANAVKHAGARSLQIRMQHHGGVLRIAVTDDGAGGANPANGTGLRGVEQRLGAFDGILAVSSPPGGPTIIAIEVPCALSSPKISSC